MLKPLPALVLVLAAAVAAAPGHAQVTAEALGDRIVRFHADEASRARELPSVALVRDFPGLGAPPAGFATTPRFSSAAGGRVVHVDVEPGTNLYGTGEVAVDDDQRAVAAAFLERCKLHYSAACFRSGARHDFT